MLINPFGEPQQFMMSVSPFRKNLVDFSLGNEIIWAAP